MNKKVFRQMMIDISLTWWIIALPVAAFAADTNTLAERHFEKANTLLKQEQYEAAISEYENIVKLVTRSEIAQDAQYWIGQSYFRMGEFDKALSIFEKLIEDYQESAIVPVTQLMMRRVQQEKENEKLRAKRNAASDRKVIIDQKTGLKYTKIQTFTGKKDIIKYTWSLNLSPNGKFLLWGKLVIPLNDGEPFDLTEMPAERGVWSPDGRKVAFSSEGAIWVIPVSPETGKAAGPAKKLLEGEYWYQVFSWAPDSERIVFERRDKEIRGDIYTLSIKDGKLTCVTDSPVLEDSPIWSPDGKTIAYRLGYFVQTIPVEGGAPKRIATKGRNYPVSWVPNGEWLIYGEGSKFRFFHLADEYEFEIEPLWNEVGNFFSWSSDGKKMLFYKSSYDWVSALKVVSTSGGPSFELGSELKLSPYIHFWSADSEIILTEGKNKDGDSVYWAIPLVGGEPFFLKLDVSVTGKPYPLSLSADCQKLLFVTKNDNETEDLWVVPVSLKEARTTGPAVKVFNEWDKKHPYSYAFSLSSDGTKIAVTHKWDIWVASTDGSEPVQIAIEKPRGHRYSPSWSPDGKMLAYRAYRTEKEKMFRVISKPDSEANIILDIPFNDECICAWSPDSKKLAFFSEEVVSVITTPGAKSRRILNLKDFGIDDIWKLCWSPDGQNLAFISSMKTSEQNKIWIIPAEGGEAREFATDDLGEKYRLYWSPDGKWISYNSDGSVKRCPEGVIWEANIEEFLSRLEKERRR